LLSETIVVLKWLPYCLKRAIVVLK
jgi:hypothetical protein